MLTVGRGGAHLLISYIYSVWQAQRQDALKIEVFHVPDIQ